ncbi:hypothetical protein [Myceligenerans crystallogenes]|uniref:Uncharacterized protein n=1 Tax=Myceligenerans crystallogenes TaxID=316335 RepID=A0ABN2NBX3_9MICO
MAPLDDSPRHATPRQARKAWDPRPLLSDLKAGVQAQLSRADVPGEGPDGAGVSTVAQPTVDAGMSDPAGSENARVGGSAMVHAPVAPDSAESRDKKNLRRAAEAAEAAAAQAAGAASQAAITAERAMSEAHAARTDAAAASRNVTAALGELSAAAEEISALHRTLQDVRERARREVLVAWGGAGVALLVAVVALLV